MNDPPRMAHRATEVTLTDTCVFHLHTASRRSAKTRFSRRRGASRPTPFGAATRTISLRDFTYEPLKQRPAQRPGSHLSPLRPSGHERGHAKSRKRRAGGEIRSESWRVTREAGQAAERAAVKEIIYFYQHYGGLGSSELAAAGRLAGGRRAARMGAGRGEIGALRSRAHRCAQSR